MKNHQRGRAAVIALAVIGSLLALGVVVAMVLIGIYNQANSLDQKVKYEHQNNKNILSQYNQKVLEAAQVPEMMRDDLMKVATAAIEGRYGPDGSRAVFQMITEQNPNVSPEVYTKLQQIIEAGRDEFKGAQTRLLDIKRAYETQLGSVPTGALMKFMGFPKVPLETYNIVTTQGTEDAFKAGKEQAPIQLRKPAP